MRLIKIRDSLHDVSIVCDSRNTRNGFAHDATMFINGCKIASASCHYLNRTWERWTYESVCLACVDSAIEDRKAAIKSEFKADRGLNRVAGKAKDELAALTAKDLRILTLNEVRDDLRRNYY